MAFDPTVLYFTSPVGRRKDVSGTPTYFNGADYSDSAITVVGGIVTAVDLSGLGGGGTSNHQALANLSWQDSDHTGTGGTAVELAAFAGDGSAILLHAGAGISLDSGTGEISCTLGTGTANAIPFYSSPGGTITNDAYLSYSASTQILFSPNLLTTRIESDTTGVKIPALTGSRVLVSDASSYVVSSSITDTELGYLSGVSSNIQAQINGLIAGHSWKVSVRAATTANGVMASAFANGQTVDGVTLATGDRILIKNQTSGAENGIYTVNASGAPTRAADMDTDAEALQATVFVRQGTTNADTQWTVTNDSITLGTTALTFAQVSGAGTYTNGSGITLTGNVFSISASAITNSMLADATLQALATFNTNGIICQTAADTFTGRTLTGTAGKITVTNGDGVSGNPTFTIDSGYVGQNSITTVGTIATGTWNATIISLAKGGTGADLSATGPGYLVQATNGAVATSAADLLVVKNTSGATANASECGYIDSAGEYKTTTTANFEGNWCVVVSGAANNSDIVVARRGRVTIKCTASNSAGNFLALSTTAGQAVASSTMRGECFAVVTTANGSGAGGTCTALLLTQTRFVPTSNSNFGYHIASHADTDFVATINGAPSTTSVVYNAPSSGSDTVIKPQSSSNYLKARLYNTTRGTYRLIDSVNTATKTITTVASTDSWASGDTIKIESQTITSGTTAKMIELDATQSAALSAIPATARAAVFEITVFDSSAVNKAVFLHPFETFASSKQTGGRNANTGASMLSHATIKLINRVFGILSEAGGATSKTTALALTGYYEAVP